MINIRNYKALIFDLDGTLVDSSIAIRKVFSAWCRTHNLNLEQVLKAAQGTRVVDCLHEFAPHLDPQTEFDYLSAQEAITCDGICAIEGAKDFLDEIQKLGIKWGIATSGPSPVATMRLQEAKLPMPEVFVTAEQVSKGKPNPEHFLKTAQLLNVAPQNCLVFEDSKNGIAGAIAAGCDLVIVGDEKPAPSQQIKAQISNFIPLLQYSRELQDVS